MSPIKVRYSSQKNMLCASQCERTPFTRFIIGLLDVTVSLPTVESCPHQVGIHQKSPSSKRNLHATIKVENY